MSIAPSRAASPEAVRKLVEACRRGLRMEVTYASMNNPSGEERIIAPHPIVSSGRRWHVRAFCEKNRDYRDFIIGRFLSISDDCGSRLNDPAEDADWHQEITLRLIPHPKLNAAQKCLIQHERGMTNGGLLVTTRKATATYLMQLIQVPTEPVDDPVAAPVVLEDLEAIKGMGFGRKTPAPARPLRSSTQ